MLAMRAMAALALGAAMMFESWGFVMPHQDPTDILILVNKTNKNYKYIQIEFTLYDEDGKWLVEKEVPA